MYKFQCRDCGQDLHLDSNVVSKNGKKIPLGDDDRPHNCSMREQEPWESESFKCKSCRAEIYVTDERLSVSGKRIPLDVVNDQPHQCPKRDRSFPCKFCGAKLFVLDHIRSKSGVRIPLEVANQGVHMCGYRERHEGVTPPDAISKRDSLSVGN